MLQVRLGVAEVTRTAQFKGPHPLGERAFDTSSFGIQAVAGITGLLCPRRLECLVLGSRPEMELPPELLRPGTPGTRRTGPTGRGGEMDGDLLGATVRAGLLPARGVLALRTPYPSLRPVNRKLV